MHRIFLLSLIVLSTACQLSPDDNKTNTTEVKIVSAMKQVMWKGELSSKIDLDTIAERKALYGIGPLVGLKGELMIYDGISYVSMAKEDSSVIVGQNFEVSAPFFVYANVNKWEEVDLADDIISLSDLEEFIDSSCQARTAPFVFKLEGTVKSAMLHLQNLAEGTKVSSPKEAHQGQLDYQIKDREVMIIGFFSRVHQGVFTHHDRFMHLHLLTKDLEMMGHLDRMEIDELKLFISN